jgi:GNAT superfamily N-acetyltransferase
MEFQIRTYQAGDDRRLAEMVKRCLVQVNSRDYSSQIIDRLCLYYSPERFVELSRRRRIYIAGSGSSVLGTVSREDNHVYTMFVDSDRAGHGIGRQLMRHIESRVAQEGHDNMETEASITAHKFYRRLGYIDLHEEQTDMGLLHVMRKRLH